VSLILTSVQQKSVQNSMRQALVALSDHIADPALRYVLLSAHFLTLLKRDTVLVFFLFVCVLYMYGILFNIFYAVLYFLCF
jgi:hypothetical protein